MRFRRAPWRVVIVCSVALLCLVCKKNPVAPEVTQNVQLSLEYATCKEVALKIGFSDAPNGSAYRIVRNDNYTLAGTFSGPFAIVYDTMVMAATSYQYVGSRVLNGQIKEFGSPVSVTTLDSTRHNVSWQLFTLGDGSGSSELYDVSIINDTLAYAVGQIYKLDSIGNIDYQPYNLATWNGKAWTIQKVPYHFQGTVNYSPFLTLFALSANDIWLGGNGIIHFDGTTFTEVLAFNSVWGSYAVRKMWGDSSSLYVVGDAGAAAYYDGVTWTRLSTGTGLDFRDVYGATDPHSGEEQVLAVCTRNYPVDKGILRFSGGNVTSLSTSQMPYELFGIWFIPNEHYYAVGDGIYEKRNLWDTSWLNGPLDITRYVITKVRGNATNDVFAVGAFGEVIHYNGSSWTSYISQTGLTNGSYAGLGVKGNTVIAVGLDGGLAVAAVGKKF